MDRPLEVAFHNLQPSPAIEAELRQHVDKLERRFGRVIGCRVAVEKQHHQHRTGNIFEVHINLSLPGQELVVSRQPQKPRQRRANPDIHASIRDAFTCILHLPGRGRRTRGNVSHRPNWTPLIRATSRIADHAAQELKH